MKIAVVFFLLTLFCTDAHAQSVFSVDSVLRAGRDRWHRDSARIQHWGDSLQGLVRARFAGDSLALHGVRDSVGQLKNKVDSTMRRVEQRRDSVLGFVKAKKDSLLSRSIHRYHEWESVVRSAPGAGALPSVPDFAQLPDLPGLPEIHMPALTSLKSALPGMPELPGFNIKSFSGNENLPELSAVTRSPDAALEKAVMANESFNGVANYLNEAKQVQQELMQKNAVARDPALIVDEIKDAVVEKAVDHFADDATPFHQAMSQISRYKSKYSHVKQLSDLRKLPRNSMHGKAFRERFRPGVSFYIVDKNEGIADISAYGSYRLTGMITAAVGWNQRFDVGLQPRAVYVKPVAWGPQVFIEFGKWRGFAAHVEVLWQRVPFLQQAVPGNESRRHAWVTTPLVGVKRDYQLYRKIRGTAFMMFPLALPQGMRYRKDMMTRFGFEFRLGRRKVHMSGE